MNHTPITICARLVADPEVRTTAKGDVCTMRVVVNEWRRDGDGSYVDGPSSFYTVSAWGELGSEIQQCLRKGHRVLVAGTLRVNSYQADGRNLERVEVRAEHVGPDLRFGSAMYRPRQRGARAAAPDRSAVVQHPVGGYDDQPVRSSEAAPVGYEVLDATASTEELADKLATA